MYANATPHASAAIPPQAIHTPATQPASPHGQPGQPGHQQPTTWGQPAQVPAPPAAHTRTQATRQTAPALVTGAYQLSGDPGIDRMLRLERALKQFGPAF